jgi:hypothetical protein
MMHRCLSPRFRRSLVSWHLPHLVVLSTILRLGMQRLWPAWSHHPLHAIAVGGSLALLWGLAHQWSPKSFLTRSEGHAHSNALSRSNGSDASPVLPSSSSESSS